MTGATGANGAQGPSGVVTTGVFSGPVASIAGSSFVYVFAGGTVTVTTTASQRLTGAAVVSLGSTASGTGQLIDYGLCYQPSTGGAIANFMGANYASGVVYPDSRTFAAAASVLPGAGTWKVGFCVRNGYGSNAIDNNHWVNGWVQVTD